VAEAVTSVAPSRTVTRPAASANDGTVPSAKANSCTASRESEIETAFVPLLPFEPFDPLIPFDPLTPARAFVTVNTLSTVTPP